MVRKNRNIRKGTKVCEWRIFWFLRDVILNYLEEIEEGMRRKGKRDKTKFKNNIYFCKKQERKQGKLITLFLSLQFTHSIMSTPPFPSFCE